MGWFRLPVVYRLGDGGWCCMVLFCLVISGGCLGGVMVLGYEFLCHDVGLGYGVCCWWVCYCY